MVILGEKLGTDPRIGQPSWYRLCQEPFFSGAVDLSITVDDFTKDCYTRIVRGLSVESVWCVGRDFPCMVSIDSNHHGSQI
jgi:hypothetical protein